MRGDGGGESSEEGDYGDEDEASESDSFEAEDGEEEEVVIKRPKKVRKFSRAFESFVSMDSSITHYTFFELQSCRCLPADVLPCLLETLPTGPAPVLPLLLR